jgi:hypothetical protein
MAAMETKCIFDPVAALPAAAGDDAAGGSSKAVAIKTCVSWSGRPAASSARPDA